jgi:hypothetical protein
VADAELPDSVCSVHRRKQCLTTRVSRTVQGFPHSNRRVLYTSDPRVNKFLDQDYTFIPTTFSHPKDDQVPERKVCALLYIFVKFAGRQSRLGEQTDNE